MTRAVIIEAAPGRRRLDPRQSSPRSLVPVMVGELSSLAWTLNALKENGVDDVTYVGGYHIEKVIEAFPELSFRYVRDKARSGELEKLLKPCNSETCLVVDAATVLMPGAVHLLREGKSCAGTYESGGVRKHVGAYALDDAAVADLFAGAEPLPDSLRALEAAMDRVGIREVALDGLAAPALDKPAVAAIVLAGKAHALDRLAPLLKTAHVLDMVRFTAEEWGSARADVLARIQERFGTSCVVVRSSTVTEDGFALSAAGQFLSVLDIDAADARALESAVDDVIASFGNGGRGLHPGDEVLVQPYVHGLMASGVLLTRDPQHGSPYFVLNLDAESGRTDLVTSGGEGTIETHYLSWTAGERTVLDESHARILDVARELIRLSHFDSLDIEFGLDANGECYLFQIRPLASVAPVGLDSDDDILDVVSHLHEFAAEAFRARLGVLGGENLLGNMSDWNPAEMIGAYPRPLALSLYQALIGERAWAEARARLGYRDMTGVPLILSLGGRPYVDIRASLNSFLPADLDEGIGAQWVEACLERMRADPPLHDKVEFEVAVTCLTPDWSRHVRWLADAGLDEEACEQFRKCLLRLTTDMLEGRAESIAEQFADAERLGLRRQQFMAASSDNVAGLGRCLRQLLLDCVDLGLVPFSIMARYAFVAMSLLKGLRGAGAIDEDLYDTFLRAVPTVSGQFARDLERLTLSEIAMDDMVSRYGHLRPNSYDITSENYAAAPERYFHAAGQAAGQAGACADAGLAPGPIALLQPRAAEIEAALSKVGLDVRTETLARFMAEAIAGRERLKFEFMKSVDAILETVAGIGAHLGLSREVMSFVPVGELLGLESNSTSRVLESHLRRISGQNEKRWLLAKALRLPDLITSPDDVYAHRLEAWRPNFVTRKKVVAPPVVLDGAGTRVDIDGAIVFIRAADPGFDWIFGHPIAGLVTQYGGVASHMAIRAAEFGLPAAIGCGEPLFETLSQAPLLELDCEHRLIRPAP